ncbi:GNAT family N-acetyltransferase [Furfurilactobacillus sp. WILCCON 0119]
MIFEKYHPIMTAHYVLDWLTTYKVKDVFALRHDMTVASLSGRTVDETLTETATYVNQMMSRVMSNQALVWGIGDQRTQTYLGTVMLTDFKTEQSQATISIEVVANEDQQVISREVLLHTLAFSREELGLTMLTADVPLQNTLAQTLFEAAGFTAFPSTRGLLERHYERDLSVPIA